MTKLAERGDSSGTLGYPSEVVIENQEEGMMDLIGIRIGKGYQIILLCWYPN